MPSSTPMAALSAALVSSGLPSACKVDTNLPVFRVPPTPDMVSQLLSPSAPKSTFDMVVLAVLAAQIAILIPLPPRVAAAVFLFWRAAYNVGIGTLLHLQSRHRVLTRWAARAGVFLDPADPRNPHPGLSRALRRELAVIVRDDAALDATPLEFRTWLLFRRLVDLVLMCDFVSYCLFALSSAHRPPAEPASLLAVRWIVGVGLVLFNLWVKLDAHRVVKDYAWYWGDFFFLIDQELTFDGVFEMAPHPMYSVGYAGYYGISLMAASYPVLFISILAHAAQFAFLVIVENPHIDKTYNASRPPADAHALLGSIDLYRITDTSVLLLLLLFGVLTATTPSTPSCQLAFVLHAAAWRLWYSGGIGVLLRRQSSCQAWTRHFLKHGDSPEEAWRQWTGIYHLSTMLCHASFVAACVKLYSPPPAWHGLELLRHVLGAGLVALQLWTAASVYASLGEFGWFFGDFFWTDDSAHARLTYDGIYRFLNNPERVLGLAGAWGAALITRRAFIVALALLSHVLALAFLQLVERPHMQKLYGRRLRRDAGLVRSLKRTLPPLPSPLRRLHGGVDRVLDDSREVVEDVLAAARPRLAAGVATVVRDTSRLLRNYPVRVTVSRLEADMAGVDTEGYSLSIVEPSAPTPGTTNAKAEPNATNMAPDVWVSSEISSATVDADSNNKTIDIAAANAPTIAASNAPIPTAPKALSKAPFSAERATNEQHGSLSALPAPLIIYYGQPIRLRWTAPVNHSRCDWVGLYRVADTYGSPHVTRVSSAGRWIGVVEGGFGGVYGGWADIGVVGEEELVEVGGGEGEWECECSDRPDQRCQESTAAPFSISSSPPDSDSPSSPTSATSLSTTNTRRSSCHSHATGTLEFAGDKLFWEPGVFEFRYHHAGGHGVLAVSRAIEVRMPRFEAGGGDEGMGGGTDGIAAVGVGLKQSKKNDDDQKNDQNKSNNNIPTPAPASASIKTNADTNIYTNNDHGNDDDTSPYTAANANNTASPLRPLTQQPFSKSHPQTYPQLAIEAALLPIIRNCFDRAPGLAPTSATAPYAAASAAAICDDGPKYARRVVFAVWMMYVVFLFICFIFSVFCLRRVFVMC